MTKQEKAAWTQERRLRGEIGLTEAKNIDKRMLTPAVVHGGRSLNTWERRPTVEDHEGRTKHLNKLMAELRERRNNQ